MKGEVPDRCPHLHAGAANWIYPEIAYCFGPPAGRLMIPGREEYRSLCTTGRHVDCPMSAR